MKKKKSLILIALSLLFMLPSQSEAHWHAPAEQAARKNPIPADKASIERGGKFYETHCVSCHGKTGRGDGPEAAGLKPHAADLKHMAGHHTDGDLAWKIAVGRGAMPGWKSVLTQDQIWDVVNFLKKGI